jgi:hypothetical protein
MKTQQFASALCVLMASISAHGLTLEVHNFQNGQPLPFGYQTVANESYEMITPDREQSIKLSEAPYVDYMVPNNQGSSGITAQKVNGQFIAASNASDPGGGFLGSNMYPNPDRWHPVFEWSDGLPLPFGSDYWGVSHSGWSATQESNLVIRINLATSETVTVHHWFNDGWNYADGGHETLSGHVFNVTHYSADGNVLASEEVTLPSGGAELFFGDHRQFYFASITAQATADGDFLMLSNRGGNVGYKGTAVALLGGEASSWLGFPIDEDGWADTGTWLGSVYVALDPWTWVPVLEQWIYTMDDPAWTYLPRGDAPASGEAGTWNGYTILPGDIVDTGSAGWFAGSIYIGDAPWVWNFTAEKWMYIPSDTGWVHIPM